jgi:hypothetical protein
LKKPATAPTSEKSMPPNQQQPPTGSTKQLSAAEAAAYLIDQMNVPPWRAHFYASTGAMYQGSRDMSVAGLREAAQQMPTTVPAPGRVYEAQEPDRNPLPEKPAFQQAATATIGEEILQSLDRRELKKLAEAHGIEVLPRTTRDGITAALMDSRFGGSHGQLGEAEAVRYLVQQMNAPEERAREYARIAVMYPGFRDMSQAGLRDAARQMPTTVPNSTGRAYAAPDAAAPVTRETFVANAVADGYTAADAEWAYDWADGFWTPDVFDATMAAAAHRIMTRHRQPRTGPVSTSSLNSAPATGTRAGEQDAVNTGHDEVARTDLTVPVAEQRLGEVAADVDAAGAEWTVAAGRAGALAARVAAAPWTTTAITEVFTGLADRVGTRAAVRDEVTAMREGLASAGRALTDAITTVGVPAAAAGAQGDAEAFR